MKYNAVRIRGGRMMSGDEINLRTSAAEINGSVVSRTSKADGNGHRVCDELVGERN